MSYADLFEQILEKPQLYVGNFSITLITAFMHGYKYAHLEIGDHSNEDLYLGFQRFVPEWFNIESSHSWDRIVSFMTSNELEAFETTKKLWEQYKANGSKPLPATDRCVAAD